LFFSYLCQIKESCLYKMKFTLTACLLFICVIVFAANKQHYTILYDEHKVDSLYDIVRNTQASYPSKLKAMSDAGNVSMYSEYIDKLYPMFNDFLAQSVKASNNDGILLSYNSMAYLHIASWNRCNAVKYLDSAEVYVSQTENPKLLATYYNLRGQYVHRYYPNRSPEAIGLYHKSLSYYDKSGIYGCEDDFVMVVRNITLDAIQRNDFAYVQKNLEKLNALKNNYNSPILEFSYMDVNASLNFAYYHDSHDDVLLDSTIYYTKKAIDFYEQGLLPMPYSYIAVDLYTMVAEAMSMKRSLNPVAIDSLLLIAQEKPEFVDSISIARVYQAKAHTFLRRNMIDSAEVWVLAAKNYLTAGYKANYYSLLKKNIEILSNIYLEKGDYRAVIEHNDLWTKIDEEIRANEVKELELQYEVDAKDSELKSLNSDRLYQQNRHNMLILICVLLLIAVMSFLFLIRSKRKSLNRQFALVNAEREEAKLQLKLKEEQALKIRMKKYEVLSGFHLKEMELIGTTKDLEQLYKDKEALDKQVELYRQKVEAYEILENKGEHTNNYTQSVIIEDLNRLIARQLPSNDVYLNNLESLSRSCIDSLREKSDGSISTSYLKYCVCFAIGMSISDVVECFGIEQATVHMVRYRLKKKFRLGGDDDLGAFLQEHAKIDALYKPSD